MFVMVLDWIIILFLKSLKTNDKNYLNFYNFYLILIEKQIKKIFFMVGPIFVGHEIVIPTLFHGTSYPT